MFLFLAWICLNCAQTWGAIRAQPAVGHSWPLIQYIPYRILTSWGIVGYLVLHKTSHTSQTTHAWKCQWVQQRLQLWGPRNPWQARGPILVAHKTLTKSSTYVKFVITFEGAANPTHNLSLCGSHNYNWYG